MSAESENFRELRRLLALKRYEQPPPGYFDGFSSKVIARIEAGDHRQNNSLLALLFGQGSWLLRLRGAFGTKPILAGAFGITVCSVLIAGVAYSDRSDFGGAPALVSPSGDQAGLAQLGTTRADNLLHSSSTAVLPVAGSIIPTEERTSLFQEVQQPRPQLIMVHQGTAN
jgi:hypothetical protein